MMLPDWPECRQVTEWAAMAGDTEEVGCQGWRVLASDTGKQAPIQPSPLLSQCCAQLTHVRLTLQIIILQ
jgi:hypothetical protein